MGKDRAIEPETRQFKQYNPVDPVEKYKRSLLQYDRTKWHEIYDAVYNYNDFSIDIAA